MNNQKNKVRGIGKSYLLIFLTSFILVLFISLVSSFGYVDVTKPKLEAPKNNLVTSTNGTVVNVNNSDFLGGFPASYFYPYNNPYNFINISSLFFYPYSNPLNFINTTSSSNPFDQVLNTTSNVTFANANITGDLFVSNATIYIGNVSMSSETGDLKIVGGIVNGTLAGDGSRIFNLNLTNISIDGDTINATNFYGGYFNGTFNWSVNQNSKAYLQFDGNTLTYNESQLNSTIQNLAQVKAYNNFTVITTSSGVGNGQTAVLNGFLIQRIRVMPSSNSTKYHFYAYQTTSGDVIDQNRILHTGVWDISNTIAIINSSVSYNITSSNPDDTFVVKLIYINNFNP